MKVEIKPDMVSVRNIYSPKHCLHPMNLQFFILRWRSLGLKHYSIVIRHPCSRPSLLIAYLLQFGQCRFFFILTSAFLFAYSAVETLQGLLSWDNFMRLAVQWKTMRSQSSSLFCSFEDPLSQERGKHEYFSLACTRIASTMPARYEHRLMKF